MNIIIPLGGLGERFFNEGYNKPKPLIKILGKSMIQHVIDSLQLNKNDNLIIIYSQCLNKHDFDKIIMHNYDNVILIHLKHQTEGAVETILCGIEYLYQNHKSLLDNKMVIVDGDTIYNTDILRKFIVKEHNAIFCFNDTLDKPIYSYTKVDKNSNYVTDIKEKSKISDLANTGCYCFENGHVLKYYCEKVIKENIREKNEYYTSCVIKEMLSDNLLFEAIIIDRTDFDCVGTPYQLKQYAINNEYKSSKNRICFDLDNTLVTFPESKDDYTSVKPIHKNIELLRKLKSVGNTIIIYTARRMRTFDGNIGKITRDVGKITLDTLEKFDIPYDELYFGKPYADFYIDDLAINSCEQLEKATGFYHNFIKERSYNRIEVVDNIKIRKTTNIKNGLEGEIFFYKNIPKNIIDLFPKFISNYENEEYLIEKINGITLSRNFTSETFDEEMLLKLLSNIKDIHNSCTSISNSVNINIYSNYADKLKNRYENFDYSIFNDYMRTYEKIMDFCINYEKNDEGILGVIHGDPVFSNIIITENDSFKFIDMRGKVGDKLTIVGDIFYDYSKIYQSLIGYDEILLNEIVSNKYRTQMINAFNKYIISTYGSRSLYNIKMISNTLLFTLIPLHNDEKIYKYYSLIHI